MRITAIVFLVGLVPVGVTAQANRVIGVGVAGLGIYGAFGSTECTSATPSHIDPADGRCKSGWFNHLEQGDPLYDHGLPARDPIQVAGGLAVAGVGAYFAARPHSGMVESISYIGLGGAMIAGAFDYRCRGTRIKNVGCINTNITSSRFLEDASETPFSRPSLLYGGLGVTGMGLLRLLGGDTPVVQLDPQPGGARLSRTFSF